MSDLLIKGKFVLHSGQPSFWKIEGDNISNSMWDIIAELSREVLPLTNYGELVPIPKGGLPFAAAILRMKPAIVGYNKSIPLIVDDVWTTGKSMEEYLLNHKGAQGLTAFSRGNTYKSSVRSVIRVGY
jgi:orotate phosphoribosyltransferase